ncbi:hypothetical protein SELMODRAFT_72137, partial [Selaginella moellendorffii]
ISNLIVQMYGRCGSVEAARRVFDAIHAPNSFSWNIMLSAYATKGHLDEASAFFNAMPMAAGIPDEVSISSVLTACTHQGMVEIARQVVISFQNDYGIQPLREHYSGMLDILGRSGHLECAANLVRTMPYTPRIPDYGALLASCKTLENVEFGGEIARKLLELNRDDSSSYVSVAD